MRAFFRTVSLLTLLLMLAACQGNQSIVNNVQERDANEIVVFLASKGIVAQKVAASAGAAGGVGGPTNLFDISVPAERATEAMALLNSSGLPRQLGTTLLDLFSGKGLMTSDKEDQIRYQAGLAQQICNTIRKIDGVLDADVQVSFPSGDQLPGTPPQKITAAVYVKHQGMMEDPNSHIETKIKRLVSGSVTGLSVDDISVVSDRARYADITLTPSMESFGGKNGGEAYVSIWSIVMTKGSLSRFRFLFFTLVILVLLLTAGLGWMVYKFYPQLLPKKQPPPEL